MKDRDKPVRRWLEGTVTSFAFGGLLGLALAWCSSPFLPPARAC